MPGHRLDLGSLRQLRSDRPHSPSQTGTYSLTRARSLLQAPGFGLEYVNNSNTASIRQNVDQRRGRMASAPNIATCESGFNIFEGWDNISQDCKDALKAELKNRSTVNQMICRSQHHRHPDRPAGRAN